ncbi:mpv17-like protein isoform X1 [Leptinotarsa decemlineata]|uniref:mpv17-like protein isoform X1 n=2 Tax=Leptinotarsa decemlineata TaxID=7539 RepID=UPI003D3084C4
MPFPKIKTSQRIYLSTNMNNFRNFINKSLKTHPIVTNSLIYGTLCTGAEFSQQIISKKVLAKHTQPLDYGIIGRYTIYGTSIGGPLISLWYRFLDKKFQGTTTKIIVQKLLVDQFTFTAALLVVFYVSMSVMERKADIFEECRNKFGQTFKSSCMFWIPAQTINFIMIPPMYRVTYIGLCSFAWINILCCFKRSQ